MDPTRFQLVERIFRSVCDATAENRARLLQELCGQDDALRAEVEQLLHHDHTPPTFANDSNLGRPVAIAGMGVVPTPVLPEMVGSFRLGDRIGAGGMGEVYRAEQDAPRRSVAVKILRAGAASTEALRRFQHESQVLARLQHPGIAAIIEAGTFSHDGLDRPYFAMEFVRGRPLTDAAVGMATPDKLALFSQVCSAVEHAHQRGVIHRDLKPSNILVTDDDAGQRVKVLDFGVARIVTASEHTQTLHTMHGQVIGTLPYIAPEQVSGNANDVDTRADVYSLGVVLFELLTSRLPIDVSKSSLAQAARAIAESPPTRISSMNRELRGDLDTIVARSLEKEPQRRYQSVRDLRLDIERYLRDEPIEARDPGVWEQSARFARRNKGLVTALAVAAVALVGGTAASLEWASRAAAAEREATDRLAQVDAERTKLAAVNAMLSDLLASPNPMEAAKAGLQATTDIRVIDVLDAFAEGLPQRLPDQPAARAALHLSIAKSYSALEVTDKAKVQAILARDLARKVEGPASSTAIESAMALASAMQIAGENEAALALYQQTLREATAALGPNHSTTIGVESGVVASVYYLDRQEEARDLALAQAERVAAALGPNHKEMMGINHNLGYLEMLLGRFDEAEPRLKAALDARVATLGEGHAETLATAAGLANVYRQTGRSDEAEKILELVVRGHVAMFGPTHRITLQNCHNLAVVRAGMSEEKKKAAADDFAFVIAETARTLGPDHPELVDTHNSYASVLADLSRWPEAIEQADRAVELATMTKSDNTTLCRALVTRTTVLRRAGGPRDALRDARPALDQVRAAMGPEHPLTLRAMRELALCLIDAGSFAEAEPILLQIRAAREKSGGKGLDDADRDLKSLRDRMQQNQRPDGAASPPDE